jgi:uncharacterized protein (DUF2147 family)
MSCIGRASAIRLASVLLLGLAAPVNAQVPSPIGEWTTEGDKARVRIAACPEDAEQLCGVITWSYRPPGAEAGPLLDINNQDPTLRSRPIIGLPLLRGFTATGPDSWGGGTIYDPEGGKTYKSKMQLDGADQLEVSGCILIFCRGQTWTRYAAAQANP